MYNTGFILGIGTLPVIMKVPETIYGVLMPDTVKDFVFHLIFIVTQQYEYHYHHC